MFFELIQHAKTILLVFLALILLLVHAKCLYYRISPGVSNGHLIAGHFLLYTHTSLEWFSSHHNTITALSLLSYNIQKSAVILDTFVGFHDQHFNLDIKIAHCSAAKKIKNRVRGQNFEKCMKRKNTYTQQGMWELSKHNESQFKKILLFWNSIVVCKVRICPTTLWANLYQNTDFC